MKETDITDQLIIADLPEMLPPPPLNYKLTNKEISAIDGYQLPN